VAEAAETGRAPEWEPRAFPQSWWQTRQSREVLAERLLVLFAGPAAGRTRDKTWRRGLTRLLDWLRRQPGDTWQGKWLAGGADAAGSGWTDLPLKDRVPARGHHGDELCAGLVLLAAGQVLRPGYRWLLRQRQDLLLAEARAAIDPDGLGSLEVQARRPVRDLLVEYFTERAPELDHNSLRHIADTIGRLFWRDLEIRHPGIGSLRLEPAVAQARKERLAYIRDAGGHPVRPRVNFRSELVFVRAFYEDIARWAADDPGRWAPWVAPSPVKGALRAGNAALPLVPAYDVFEQTWSAPMPFLFQRRYGSEDRPINRSYIRECMVTTSRAAQITIAGQPLEWRPRDLSRRRGHSPPGLHRPPAGRAAQRRIP
jgi:hypothetical protein